MESIISKNRIFQMYCKRFSLIVLCSMIINVILPALDVIMTCFGFMRVPSIYLHLLFLPFSISSVFHFSKIINYVLIYSIPFFQLVISFVGFIEVSNHNQEIWMVRFFQTVLVPLNLIPFAIWTVYTGRKKQRKAYFLILIGLYLTQFINIIVTFIESGILISSPSLNGEQINPHTVPDLISFISIGLMVCSYGKMKTFSYQLTVYISTIVVLSMALSRTSLLLFVLTGAVILCHRPNSLKETLMNILKLFSIIACCFLISNTVYGVNSGAFQRILEYLSSDSSDSSAVGRSQIYFDSLALLDVYPVFLGISFPFEIRSTANIGYIHNYLSYFLSFGIILGIFSLTCLIFGIHFSIRKIIRGYRRPAYYFVIMASLGIMTTRSYLWPFLYLALMISVFLKPKLVLTRQIED